MDKKEQVGMGTEKEGKGYVVDLVTQLKDCKKWCKELIIFVRNPISFVS